MSKGPEAFRTISEVAEDLDLPQHVLRFWETRFTQIKPLKRGGGRRYYRPDDVDLLRGIRQLLYGEGYTIRGVQRILRENGSRFVISAGRGEIDGVAMVAQRPVSGQVEYGDDNEGNGLEEEDADYEADDDARAEPNFAARPQRILNETEMPERGNGSVADRLNGDEIETLQATLAELLECKRLLDQSR